MTAAALTLPNHAAGPKADSGFLGRWILLGAGAGAISGAVIGGVGGRLAMFVLRLTSSDLLRGATTDDGFEIGVITFDTVALIILTTIIGAVGGVAYVAMRNFISARWRVAAWGLACGSVGGAVIISDDGIDFLLLEPLSLAVAMFIVIPAAGGAWMADIVERVGRSGTAPMWLSVLGGLALLPMLFGPILILGPVFALVVVAARWAPLRTGVDQWWGRVIALSLYAVLVGLSSRALLDDVTTIL